MKKYIAVILLATVLQSKADVWTTTYTNLTSDLLYVVMSETGDYTSALGGSPYLLNPGEGATINMSSEYGFVDLFGNEVGGVHYSIAYELSYATETFCAVWPDNSVHYAYEWVLPVPEPSATAITVFMTGFAFCFGSGLVAWSARFTRTIITGGINE